MKKLYCCIMFLVVFGCANQFQTSRFDMDKWEPKGNAVNGVIYYEPQLVKITYTFTTLVDEKGNILGTAADGACERMIQKEEISVQPNYSEPRILINKPSLFASGKLGVTLNNGMLASVNSESTPLLPEIIGQIAKLKEVSMLAVPGKVGAACNAAPVITSIQRQEVPWPK